MMRFKLITRASIAFCLAALLAACAGPYEWYQQAAQGNADALSQLRKAADQGNADAQVELG